MPRFVTVAICAALSLVGVAYAQTFITVQTKSTELSKAECLDHADRAIRRAGFDVPGTTEDARHGMRGQYTVQVYCADVDKGRVFFVTAGPSGKLTEQYMDDVLKGF